MNRRRRVGLASIVLLVLAGLIGAACSASKQASVAPAKAPPEATSGAAADSGKGSEGAVGNVALEDIGLTALTARIIKTASISVEVKQDSFEDQFQQAAMIAGRHGGYVSSSRTAQAEHRSGTLVLRVPADLFEAALGELKALGTVKDEEISGQDVTSQFIDLQARLRNWEAQESVLLGLMARATTIDESIKVQRNLQDVQLAIEEIRGQLQALSDQADYSTITLAVSEVGGIIDKPKSKGPISLGRAWHEAVHGFVAVVAAVVIGLGYLVPIGLMGLALLVGWLGFRRARTRERPVQAA